MSADALRSIDHQVQKETQSLFYVRDLLPALDLLTRDWERLPRLIAGRDDYRTMILRGYAVYAFSLEAQLDHDGAITVTEVSVDLHGLPDPEDDD